MGKKGKKVRKGKRLQQQLREYARPVGWRRAGRRARIVPGRR